VIFKGSRYAKEFLYYDAEKDSPYLGFPVSSIKTDVKDIIYEFQQGDRLDIIALIIYKNPKMKWKILYANPEYETELDIKPGDKIVIPHPRRELKYG